MKLIKCIKNLYVIFGLYIFILMFILPLVSADTYTITTVPKCDGFIHVRMYFDEPYNFLGCKLDDGIYLCPCAKNKKVVLNTTIEYKHKVVVEYYLNEYKNGANRITNTYWITPSSADEKEKEAQIKLERKYFAIIIISILSIVGLISFVVFILFRRWYKKLISED